MLLKRLAAVVAAMATTMAFTSSTAIAATIPEPFQHGGSGFVCLDYRSDRGLYVTGCNDGDYQLWIRNKVSTYTTIQQVATGLCLTLRTAVLTMKPRSADIDDLQWWRIDTTEDGSLIRNRVQLGMCVARKANDDVHATTCTGGTSQRWIG